MSARLTCLMCAQSGLVECLIMLLLHHSLCPPEGMPGGILGAGPSSTRLCRGARLEWQSGVVGKQDGRQASKQSKEKNQKKATQSSFPLFDRTSIVAAVTVLWESLKSTCTCWDGRQPQPLRPLTSSDHILSSGGAAISAPAKKIILLTFLSFHCLSQI